MKKYNVKIDKGKLKMEIPVRILFLDLSLKEEKKNNGIILCTLKNGNSSQDTFFVYSLFHKTLPKSSLQMHLDLGKVLLNGRYINIKYKLIYIYNIYIL